jgi:hypothetical protein
MIMVLPVYLMVVGLVGAFAYGLDVRRWPDSAAPARITRVWAFLLVFRLGALAVSHFAREGDNALVVLSYFLVVLGWPEVALLHEFRSTASWPLVLVAGIMAGTLLWSLLVVLVMSTIRR